MSLEKRRHGFTLLELLMVISIIAILVALLMPSLMSAITTTKTKDAHAELLGLKSSLNSFKASYGYYPPSSITLYEQGGTWSPESKRKIRKLFGPEFDFGKDRDFNANGTKTDVLELSGQECLVFFLGGAVIESGGQRAPGGFSNNKADPFGLVDDPTLRGTRKFFFKFDVARLVDTNGNGMFEYLDKLQSSRTSPLLYFSSDPSYNPNDCPGTLTSVYYNGSPEWPWDKFQIVSPGRDGEYGIGGNYITTDDSWMSPQPNATPPQPARYNEADNLTQFSHGTLGGN